MVAASPSYHEVDLQQLNYWPTNRKRHQSRVGSLGSLVWTVRASFHAVCRRARLSTMCSEVACLDVGAPSLTSPHLTSFLAPSLTSLHFIPRTFPHFTSFHFSANTTIVPPLFASLPHFPQATYQSNISFDPKKHGFKTWIPVRSPSLAQDPSIFSDCRAFLPSSQPL